MVGSNLYHFILLRLLFKTKISYKYRMLKWKPILWHWNLIIFLDYSLFACYIEISIPPCYNHPVSLEVRLYSYTQVSKINCLCISTPMQIHACHSPAPTPLSLNYLSHLLEFPSFTLCILLFRPGVSYQPSVVTLITRITIKHIKTFKRKLILKRFHFIIKLEK